MDSGLGFERKIICVHQDLRIKSGIGCVIVRINNIQTFIYLYIFVLKLPRVGDCCL